MRRNLLVMLALLLGITTLHAKPVDVAKAQRLGQNFVQHKAMFAKNAVQDLQLAYTHHADNGMATMYVFNFDGGYVIVAADDSSSPILGYASRFFQRETMSLETGLPCATAVTIPFESSSSMKRSPSGVFS